MQCTSMYFKRHTSKSTGNGLLTDLLSVMSLTNIKWLSQLLMLDSVLCSQTEGIVYNTGGYYAYREKRVPGTPRASPELGKGEARDQTPLRIGTQGNIHKSQHWATLTQVSTMLQRGTTLQQGLKYGWGSSAVMSHRCVCAWAWRTGEHWKTGATLQKNTAPQDSHWRIMTTW